MVKVHPGDDISVPFFEVIKNPRHQIHVRVWRQRFTLLRVTDDVDFWWLQKMAQGPYRHQTPSTLYPFSHQNVIGLFLKKMTWVIPLEMEN